MLNLVPLAGEQVSDLEIKPLNLNLNLNQTGLFLEFSGRAVFVELYFPQCLIRSQMT